MAVAHLNERKSCGVELAFVIVYQDRTPDAADECKDVFGDFSGGRFFKSDIAHGQSSARPKHAVNLPENRRFIGGEIDDAIANDAID
jgi:hypothetical protein